MAKAKKSYHEDDETTNNNRFARNRNIVSHPKPCIHDADLAGRATIFRHVRTGELMMEGDLVTHQQYNPDHSTVALQRVTPYKSGRYRRTKNGLIHATNGIELKPNPNYAQVEVRSYYDAIQCVSEQRLV